MFGFLRRSRKPRLGDDHVWASEAACRKGLVREVERLLAEGTSVLVVATTAAGLDAFVAALESHAPATFKDRFGRRSLRQRLDQPRTLSLAQAAAVRPEGAPGGVDEPASASATPVEVLVAGRHDHRDEDEAVVAFAEPFGPRARVTFHLSLDDPLLREMAGRVKELLERLGMTEDEPVAHAMVSRAIAKAQRG